jgi:hypothetical protein
MGTHDDMTNIQTILDLYPRFFKHPARTIAIASLLRAVNAKTFVFNLPDDVLHMHTKQKSSGIKFGDLGSQAISAPLPIHPPGIL